MINKVFFDITGVCNANCKYCFTNASSVKSNRELNEDQIACFEKACKFLDSNIN